MLLHVNPGLTVQAVAVAVMKEIEIQGLLAQHGNLMKAFWRADCAIDDSQHFFDDIIAGINENTAI